MKHPAPPPQLSDLLEADGKNDRKQTDINSIAKLMSSDIGRDRDPAYVHWDKLRYKPLPEGVSSHEQWWLLTKFRRQSAYRKLPFLATDGSHFVYWINDPNLERLHRIDQQASGRVEVPEEVTNDRTRDRYLVSSLIEEAITSSQLEGASTTYRVAKAMLRENRQPRDKDERMIFNNYRAMTYIRELTNENLSKDLLFELHRVVTDGTLDNPESAGRFRRSEEDIAVYDNRDNTLLHMPPHASELEARMERICRFANSELDDDTFLHPAIRSIILHLMVAYDHPFVDGNGRTARALFYWSMAKHGYWLMEHLSISSILKQGPSKYARAYLYTESDENDASYFIDFNLMVIQRAIVRLREYLARKSGEIQRVERLIGNSMLAKNMNHRQLAVVSHALRNPGEVYTIESHRKSHDVTYPTARSDLLWLSRHELLTKRKVGSAFVFEGAFDIENRIEELRRKFDSGKKGGK